MELDLQMTGNTKKKKGFQFKSGDKSTFKVFKQFNTPNITKSTKFVKFPIANLINEELFNQDNSSEEFS